MGKLILRAALIKNLRRFDDSLKAQVPQSWKIIDRCKRTLITLLGEITYMRRCYLDEYGIRHYLLDEVLGIPPRVRIEPSTFIWLVRRSADVSFAKTARDFKSATGTELSRMTIMRCVHKAGELLASAKTSHLPQVSSSVLFVEFDGFWVHLQKETKEPKALPRKTYKEQFRKKSKEMKVWCAYSGIKNHRRGGVVHFASDEKPADFFAEALSYTFSHYDINGVRYIVTGSDAAEWCKAHGIDEALLDKVVVISKLDRFHINRKVMRAFSSEEDRNEYLGYLYANDYAGFFSALDERLIAEPDHEKVELRKDLYSYIANNLDWLQGPSLSRVIREHLAGDIPAVFADRSFCVYLIGLLEKRRYKRFLSALEEICARCAAHLKYDYECFLKDAHAALTMIESCRQTKLGTMEGTNSKVYAARLSVWGCAWSKRGALAMMRIRARLASGMKLLAPSYDACLGKDEQQRMRKWLERSCILPESSGSGYEPPQGSVLEAKGLTPSLYGAVRI